MFDYIMLKVRRLCRDAFKQGQESGCLGATSMVQDHGPRSQEGISTKNKPPSGHDGTAIAINRNVYQSLTNDVLKTSVNIPYLFLGNRKPCDFQCLYLRDVFKKRIHNFNKV